MYLSAASTVFPATGGSGEQLRSGFERRNKRRTADSDGEDRSHGSSDRVSLQPCGEAQRWDAAVIPCRCLLLHLSVCLLLQEWPEGGQADVGPEWFQFSVSGPEVVFPRVLHTGIGVYP